MSTQTTFTGHVRRWKPGADYRVSERIPDINNPPGIDPEDVPLFDVREEDYLDEEYCDECNSILDEWGDCPYCNYEGSEGE